MEERKGEAATDNFGSTQTKCPSVDVHVEECLDSGDVFDPLFETVKPQSQEPSATHMSTQHTTFTATSRDQDPAFPENTTPPDQHGHEPRRTPDGVDPPGL